MYLKETSYWSSSKECNVNICGSGAVLKKENLTSLEFKTDKRITMCKELASTTVIGLQNSRLNNIMHWFIRLYQFQPENTFKERKI